MQILRLYKSGPGSGLGLGLARAQPGPGPGSRSGPARASLGPGGINGVWDHPSQIRLGKLACFLKL